MSLGATRKATPDGGGIPKGCSSSPIRHLATITRRGSTFPRAERFAVVSDVFDSPRGRTFSEGMWVTTIFPTVDVVQWEQQRHCLGKSGDKRRRDKTGQAPNTDGPHGGDRGEGNVGERERELEGWSSQLFRQSRLLAAAFFHFIKPAPDLRSFVRACASS